MKQMLIFCFEIFLLHNSYSQKAVLQWNQAIGGSKTEKFEFFEQTRDSGYIIVGTTVSTDGDAVGNTGENILITKLNSSGNNLWSKIIPGDTYCPTFCEISNGFLLAYMSGGKTLLTWKNLKSFISLFDNNGNIKWTKQITSIDPYKNSAYSKIFQINDTNFVILGCSLLQYNFTLFNIDGDFITEKSIIFPQGTSFSFYRYFGSYENCNIKIGQIKNKGLYIAYDTREYYDLYLTSITSYHCYLTVLNEQGEILWYKDQPGMFIDCFYTKNNEFYLLRKEWESGTIYYEFGKEMVRLYNPDILIDKFSDDGSTKINGISSNKIVIGNDSIIHYNPRYKDIISYCITKEGNLIYTNGGTLNLIDSSKTNAFLYKSKDIINVNLIQSNKGDFYLQTIESKVNESDNTQSINNVNVLKFESTFKKIWEKTLWNIKDGHVVSFLELKDDTFLIIGKNDFGNKLSLYTVVTIDDLGNRLGSYCFYGPSESFNIINRTSDGGFLIGGIIKRKDNIINNYHGKDDIMVAKLGFE